MTSANERLKILYNILARGGGIENVDLYSELSKSLSTINSFDTQQQMSQMAAPPMPMQTPETEPGLPQETGQEGMPPIV